MAYGKANGNFLLADVSVASCAYLAGIVDGEGCITVTRLMQARKDGSLKYGIVVSIHSTSIEWIYDLRNAWGRIGSIRSYPSKQDNAKPGATWVIAGSFAKKLLTVCLPYLKIKREQALIVLDFPLVGKGSTVTSDILLQHEAAKERITTLNERGLVRVNADAFMTVQ